MVRLNQMVEFTVGGRRFSIPWIIFTALEQGGSPFDAHAVWRALFPDSFETKRSALVIAALAEWLFLEAKNRRIAALN